jgi:hypothetical protein
LVIVSIMAPFCRNVAAAILRTSAKNHGFVLRPIKASAPGMDYTTVRAFASSVRMGVGMKSRKPVSLPRSSSSIVKKRARVTAHAKSFEGSVENTWYIPKKVPLVKGLEASASASLEMGRYGLKRLDYNIVKPSLLPPPPHPPGKTLLEKYLYPFTLLTMASLGVWAYLNPEQDDMKEYWKRVETGQILMDDDDDDEEEDWDDEDDEEEDD